MSRTLWAVTVLAGCGGQGAQPSGADSDADTDTATDSGSDTQSGTGSDTSSETETVSATDTISDTTTESSTDTESGTGCDLTEPEMCESGKFVARSDVDVGAFFDVAEFCVPEDDACALDQVAAWAPAVTCSGLHEGVVVCAAGELDCDWNFDVPISAADYDALCDLSTIDVITQIQFMVWVG